MALLPEPFTAISPDANKPPHLERTSASFWHTPAEQEQSDQVTEQAAPADDLTDEEYFNFARANAPTYIPNDRRLELFDIMFMKQSVNSGRYSHNLGREILTFRDAVDAATATAQLWSQEDQYGGKNPALLSTAEKRKFQNKEAQTRFRNKGLSPEAEAARVAWKEAVIQQQQAIQGWKDHVRQLRRVYEDLS